MTAPPAVIDDVVATYEQAAAANRATAARRGNVVVLSPDEADDVFISADLHGNRRNFHKLLERADLDGHPRRHLVMHEVCHGGPEYPTPGGGCMSHLLLEDVARLKVRYPERLHFLLSNHEWAELVDFPIIKGGRMLNLVFRCGLQEMYGEALGRVRTAMLDFLRSLPLAVRLTNGVFISHSAPGGLERNEFDVSIFDRPLEQADYAERGPLFRLIWGRDFRPENAERFRQLVDAEVLIQGHEPCDDGFDLPNDRQIVLDCCDERASYVIVPTAPRLTHAEVAARIQRLHAVRHASGS